MLQRSAGNLTLLLVFMCFALGALPGVSQATIVKNLEFNVDGILPSAEPDITLANNTGNPEGSIYSVGGGLLAQRTLSINGNASYGFPTGSIVGAGIDPAQSFSIDARLRVLGIDGLGGAFFQMFDGAHRYSIFFAPGTVQVLGASGFDAFALDLTQFHTYRLESAGGTNAFDFFIDGVLMHSDVAGANGSFNGFNFGDGITEPGKGADVDWDFVRFVQPVSEVQVPEARHVFLFGWSFLLIVALRRRVADTCRI